MSIFEKFKAGFKKSAENFATGLKEIIIKKEIDDKSLDKIEEFLISSDVGIEAASEIKSIISQEKIDPNLDSIQEINKILKNYIISVMKPLEKSEFLAEDYSIADIATFPWIARHEWHDVGLKNFKHLTRWYNEISKREAVIKGFDLLKREEKIPKP